MERLTERYESGGTAMIKGCGDNCKYGCRHCTNGGDIGDCGTIDDVVDKLADYEDAEEQGLLLRLPCRVGTHIYMINRYWIDEGRICGIAEADDIDCFCFKVYCDPDDYTMVAIADFNETWFLTREEAEKALADMGV